MLKICKDCKNMRDIRYIIDIRDMLLESYYNMKY